MATAQELKARALRAGSTREPMAEFQTWLGAEYPLIRDGDRRGIERQAQRCWEVIEANNRGQNTEDDARAQLRAIAAEIDGPLG